MCLHRRVRRVRRSWRTRLCHTRHTRQCQMVARPVSGTVAARSTGPMPARCTLVVWITPSRDVCARSLEPSEIALLARATTRAVAAVAVDAVPGCTLSVGITRLTVGLIRHTRSATITPVRGDAVTNHGARRRTRCTRTYCKRGTRVGAAVVRTRSSPVTGIRQLLRTRRTRLCHTRHTRQR